MSPRVRAEPARSRSRRTVPVMAGVLLATGDRVGRVAADGDEIEWSLEGTGAANLAFDPNDPDTVYVGRHAGGVARSLDGGRSGPRTCAGSRRVPMTARSFSWGSSWAG